MIRKDLIDKFYKGECTEAEVRQVLSWFDDRQEGEKHIEALWDSHAAVEYPFVHEPDKTLATIQQRVGTKKTHAQFHLLKAQWIRVAAILVLAFVLPLLIIKHELPPTTYAQVEQYTTKENPAGRKSVINLPDGSVVHLNAESSITFLESFDDSIRQISLMGEAFFEVAENKDRPFIVSASGVDTRALGTSFNVKAYKEDEGIQVVLASGKVKITQIRENNKESVFLMPGEEAWVEKQANAMHKRQADVHNALAWKDNIMVFHQAPADQVFATLERWYGVNFTFPGKFISGSWRFTGEFQNESLENVLLSISYVKAFKYKIDNKSITITP